MPDLTVPTNPRAFELVLRTMVSDQQICDLIHQYTLDEFRRGYLHGQREMKQRAENAIDALRVPGA